jgi:hypothetical protein
MKVNACMPQPFANWYTCREHCLGERNFHVVHMHQSLA